MKRPDDLTTLPRIYGDSLPETTSELEIPNPNAAWTCRKMRCAHTRGVGIVGLGATYRSWVQDGVQIGPDTAHPPGNQNDQGNHADGNETQQNGILGQ